MIEILLAYTLHSFEANWGWWSLFGFALFVKYYQLLFVMIDVTKYIGL